MSITSSWCYYGLIRLSQSRKGHYRSIKSMSFQLVMRKIGQMKENKEPRAGLSHDDLATKFGSVVLLNIVKTCFSDHIHA